MDIPTPSFSVSDIFSLVFYLVALIVVIHTVVFAYHWYTFGANKHHSLTGILVYIAGSGLLLAALAISLWYI